MLHLMMPGRYHQAARTYKYPSWLPHHCAFTGTQQQNQLLGGEAGLLFFVSITRCQCVAIPSRHGQAVVVASSHGWTSTGHASPYHVMKPPPTEVLWVQGPLGSGSGSFSPHHPSHSHTCPGKHEQSQQRRTLPWATESCFPSSCCSHICASCAKTLHTGYRCSTGPCVWHGGLHQLIRALPQGKEAGRISDKQVASASSSPALLLISSGLESNTRQPQQALAMLARSWRKSPSPRPELQGKGSPVKAVSEQTGESSRRIWHKHSLPWVTAAGAADVQQTTHVTSSPAHEGTQ